MAKSIDLSKEERLLSYGEADGLITPLLYGEALHASIAELILHCKREHNLFADASNKARAVDLGSGSGKVCLTLALVLGEFLSCSLGFELLESLSEQSASLKTQYDSSPHRTACNMEFKQKDFMESIDEWIGAELIFANATAFEPDMLASISKAWATQSKSGAVFILSTQELQVDESQAQMIGPVMRAMSWGETTVRVYVRR